MALNKNNSTQDLTVWVVIHYYGACHMLYAHIYTSMCHM